MGERLGALAPLVTPSRSPNADFWSARDVLVTGHTGFKGSWLVHWLAQLGARVHGLALDPPSTPSLFDTAMTGERLASDTRADVRNADAVRTAVRSSGASVLLHMAAQPLVRDGYRFPSATFATNVVGTTNLLEAVRGAAGFAAVVIVTTDKVYLPRDPSSAERDEPHRESDALGAEDPYAWSKVMVEQAVLAFRDLPRIDALAGWSAPIATARAGNVVGGGDWSTERLVPDCIRAFLDERVVQLRYPSAVRPWQHVLEPLNGYLLLAESLASGDVSSGGEVPAFNFGPDSEGERTVGEVASAIADRWGGAAGVCVAPDASGPPENPLLRLDSTRARERLGWSPRWDHATTLDRTVDWYRRAATGEDPAGLIGEQLVDFSG